MLNAGELRTYSVVRADQPDRVYNAFYQPTKQLLALLGNGYLVGARDIPGIVQGLQWWLQEPEVWEGHVFWTEAL